MILSMKTKTFIKETLVGYVTKQNTTMLNLDTTILLVGLRLKQPHEIAPIMENKEVLSR